MSLVTSGTHRLTSDHRCVTSGTPLTCWHLEHAFRDSSSELGRLIHDILPQFLNLDTRYTPSGTDLPNVDSSRTPIPNVLIQNTCPRNRAGGREGSSDVDIRSRWSKLGNVFEMLITTSDIRCPTLFLDNFPFLQLLIRNNFSVFQNLNLRLLGSVLDLSIHCATFGTRSLTFDSRLRLQRKIFAVVRNRFHFITMSFT